MRPSRYFLFGAFAELWETDAVRLEQDEEILDSPDVITEVQDCGKAVGPAVGDVELHAPMATSIAGSIIAKYAIVHGPALTDQVTAACAGSVRCGMALADYERQQGWAEAPDSIDPRIWTVFVGMAVAMQRELEQKGLEMPGPSLRLLALYAGYAVQRDGEGSVAEVLAGEPNPLVAIVSEA